MDAPFPNVRELDLAYEAAGTETLVSSMDSFLSGFAWASRTGKVWVGECIPGVLGLFLVELARTSEDIDRHVWVVVGDLPPAYISTEYAKSPKEAIEGYISEMESWVDAVRRGGSTDHLIPVNGAPTKVNADALESRLSFISREILPSLC